MELSSLETVACYIGMYLLLINLSGVKNVAAWQRNAAHKSWHTHSKALHMSTQRDTYKRTSENKSQSN